MSGDGFSGLLVLTFLLGVLLTLFAVATVYFVVLSRRRRCAAAKVVGKDDGAQEAWCDAEKGEFASNKCGYDVEKATPLTPRQFQETLRQLLDSDLAKKQCGLIEQLEKLDHKVSSSLIAAEQKGETKAPPLGLRAAADAAAHGGEGDFHDVKTSDTRTPNSSDRSGGERSGASSCDQPVEELPGAVASPSPLPPPVSAAPPLPGGGAPELPDHECVDTTPHPDALLAGRGAGACASAAEARMRRLDFGRPGLEFGPTEQQSELVDPPEKCHPGINEELSLQASLHTVQKVLGKRDAQTTELQRQLKEARQELWLRTSEARSANTRLNGLLSDPLRAPQAQAEAIERLCRDVKELSSQLASSRSQEKHWLSIARRQRAFFLQSEHMGQEGIQVLRRHPAGEVFVAPHPVASPYEEEDRDECGPGWNVGTSHCNPYKVDSWPFEPNVLAQRASREPNLDNCDEGDEDAEEDDDEEDYIRGRMGRGVRQQQDRRQQWSDDDHEEGEEDESPVHVPDDDDDDGEEYLGKGGEAGEPTDAPPPSGAPDTSRSL